MKTQDLSKIRDKMIHGMIESSPKVVGSKDLQEICAQFALIEVVQQKSSCYALKGLGNPVST